ncbi:MAG: hypothetical protein ACUVV5_12300 [Candidatus Aminicenantales bacterium]
MGFQVLVTAKGCPYEAATLRLKGGTGLRFIDEAIVRRVYEHGEVAETRPMLMVTIFDPNKGEKDGLSAYLGVDPALPSHENLPEIPAREVVHQAPCL